MTEFVNRESDREPLLPWLIIKVGSDNIFVENWFDVE